MRLIASHARFKHNSERLSSISFSVRCHHSMVFAMQSSMSSKALAEFSGTFWLVFGGCGSAVLAAQVLSKQGDSLINMGIGFIGAALAFGLTVMTMAFAIGHISGCHLPPAVSIGLTMSGRFKASELPPYITAQVVGAIAAAAVLYAIASGKDGVEIDNEVAGAYR